LAGIANRLEAALLNKFLRVARTERSMHESLGPEVTRDCNGPRALETLLRYRGSVFAELFRSLETLKGLQAQESTPRILAASPDEVAVARLEHKTNPRNLGKAMG
jgi:hypothetical protein